MQILLLFCLIKNFLLEDYSMERYGSAEVILNDNGYIFVNTKGFSTGDSIYITLKSFEKEYFNYIEYTYWYYESSYGIKIDQIKYAYSEEYQKQENNNSTGKNISYDYYYYFELILPRFSKDFLVMKFTKPCKNDVLLRVENTKYRRNAVKTTVINVIVGILFLITLIIFLVKYPRWYKLLKQQKNDNNNLSTPIENNNNLNEEINYPGSTITNYGNNEVEDNQNHDNKIYDNDSSMNYYPSPD